MGSPDNPGRWRRERVAIYGALAIGLYTVESFLPAPLPWVRVGIANLAVVLALEELGLAAALAVFLLKLLLGSLIAGRLFTPFFLFGAVGGGISLCAMVFVKLVSRRAVSAIGISCAGGVFHNLGQLLVARFLLLPAAGMWRLLPIFAFVGVLTGTFIGILARLVQLRLHREPLDSSGEDVIL